MEEGDYFLITPGKSESLERLVNLITRPKTETARRLLNSAARQPIFQYYFGLFDVFSFLVGTAEADVISPDFFRGNLQTQIDVVKAAAIFGERAMKRSALETLEENGREASEEWSFANRWVAKLRGLTDVLAKGKKPLPDLTGSLFVIFNQTVREIPRVDHFDSNSRAIRAAIAIELVRKGPEQIEKLKETISYGS